MKTVIAGIVAAALCVGMASPILAEGTNSAGHGAHAGKGPFEQMDANHDGKLTWDEFIAHHTTKMQAHFQEMTAKGNTTVTWDQFQAKHTAELKKRFQSMDTNSDGFVSQDEFRAFGKAHEGERPHPGGGKPPAQGATGGNTPSTP